MHLYYHLHCKFEDWLVRLLRDLTMERESENREGGIREQRGRREGEREKRGCEGAERQRDRREQRER